MRYGELEIERGGRISGAVERRADDQSNHAPQATAAVQGIQAAPTGAQGTGFIPLPPAADKLSA